MFGRLPMEAAQEVCLQDAKPPTSFDSVEQQLYPKLPLNVQTPYFISEAEHTHPREEIHFACIHSHILLVTTQNS